MTDSDKRNNLLCACAIAKFSKKKAKNTKQENNSDIKRD